MTYKKYPKPLSEKSLQKKYTELNLSENKIEFLKQFILACTNLYGRIAIKDIWEVYKELAENASVPKIKRTDIVHISEILRREVLPYFVYEVDELYREESRKILDREFVSRYLIGKGYGKFTFYYYVEQSQAYHDYYVPDDLLSFEQKQTTEQEQHLLEFIGNLKVTAKEYTNRYGKTLKCPDRIGETLDSFSFMNQMETSEYQYVKGELKGRKGDPEEAQRMLDENNSKTEAEKIVELIKWYGNIGHVSPMNMIQYTLDELEEVGVELTESQLKELTDAIIDLHNYSRLMCLGGWRPVDLAAETGMPTAITFGPGLKRAFLDDSIDIDELVKALEDLGLEYLDN